MPLMMDDHDQQYVMDDLFGDSEAVHIPSLVPPIKGLDQRIDELQEIGCCQKITWSKTGCVAAITPGGRGVELSAFHRSPSDGTWQLGEKIALAIPAASDEFPYIHVAWGHLGTDLVVIDAAGRVSIYTTIYALARMKPSKTQFANHEDEMGAIVGMHWLSLIPHQQKAHIPWSADRNGEDWSFQISSATFNHAHHPAESKAGFLTVGRNGSLKLRFQQPDSSWHEASTELEHIDSARQPFTHAAFAPDNDNTLLLVAHNVIGHLHTYRVRINWKVPQGLNPQQISKLPLNPTLKVTSLLVEDRCYPESSTGIAGDMTTGPTQQIQIPGQLTHLSFLPTTPEPGSAGFPTVLAIFSHCPSPISSLDQTQPPQSSFSIVARWELHQPQSHHLHPTIDQVSSKRKTVGGVPPRQTFRLKRLPDFMTGSLVLSSFPIFFNTTLAFCQSDGTIEFRQRSTLNVVIPDYSTNRVSSLSQAGFAFSNLDPSLHIALSANHCMAVAMQSDGEYKLKSMEYTFGPLKSIEDDPKNHAAIAALVLQHTAAANQYFTSDDIFALVDPDITDATSRAFVSQAFRALSVNLDCNQEDANNALSLMNRSTQFVKCLSAQAYFGSSNSSTGIQRNLPSKLAWAVLNIRYTTQIMTMMMRMHGAIDKNPPRPDIAASLLGLCRWMMNMMVWMIDELMTLGQTLRRHPNYNNGAYDRALLQSHLTARAAPSLILLLSSFTRMMLKNWQQPLAWISRFAGGLAQNAPTPEMRATYMPLQVAFAECPFDWRFFETLVREAIAQVAACYKRAGLSDAQRGAVEKELMMGVVPEVLMPAARRLVGGALFDQHMLLDRIDPARVMFHDIRWLGLNPSNRTREWQREHVVDVCQKFVLKPKEMRLQAKGVDGAEQQRWRRCTRCGALMEDVTPNHGRDSVDRPPTWIVSIAKHCVCQGGWMLVGWPENAVGA
ncbi:hypothetical protein BU16DRAFT_508940 [Lophium mytilinum]|uniref:Mediator of RNA polymerase II transcription subunit 16 n=1 Tax=Lophium mytilinum TaxID=390894 RepID=A0A6A6QYJ2_9PEZI|nr:hypothetical protein BU16DRAFT_508940 [Lophium mytilinum]